MLVRVYCRVPLTSLLPTWHLFLTVIPVYTLMMANYAVVLETQQALETTIQKRFADLESQLKNSTSQSGMTLNRLHEEVSDFKTHIWAILNLLRQQIYEISRIVEVGEMRHRKKYLLVSGVPENIDGSLPVHIAKLFNDKLGLRDIASHKFVSCHRLGASSDGKCRPVLVRFVDPSDRIAIWKKKTAFKGSPYVVSEFLTRARQALFMQARQQFGMRNCWTADGIIIVKSSDGSKRRIFTEEDLNGIANKDEQQDNDRPATRSPSPTAGNHSNHTTRPKRVVKHKK